MKYIFIVCLCFINLFVHADKVNIDSLLSVLNSLSANDSDKYFVCYHLSLSVKNPRDKVKYAQLAYDFSSNCGMSDWKAASKLLESYAYGLYGNTYCAIECLLISQSLYEENGDKEGEAACYGELANNYKKNKQFQMAERAYGKAIFLLITLDKELETSGYLLNLGELYRETEKLNKALSCFQKSDSLYQKLNYPYGIAYAKGNIGLVYIAQNKLDSAKIFLKKSIDILTPLGDNYAVSCYLDGLADVSFKENNFSQAKKYASKSLQLAQEHGLKEQIRDASLRLATIYSQQSNFRQAYYYKTQYINYRDSINNEETIRKIANLHTKYEVDQKQKEVDELNAQKQYYFVLAITLVITIGLFIVLVVIMLKNGKERKKFTKQLELQHKELEKSDVAKNKFFSILSHDLRGSVGVFISFAEVIKMFISNKEYDQLEPLADEMERSSHNLLDLTDNLLYWGVKQMSAIKAIPTLVKIKPVISKEVIYLKDIAGKKGINVITDIEDDLQLFVEAESMAIAVRNLLSNALKFTDINGQVTISAYSTASTTVLKISDTGVGMSSAQKQNLFNFNEITSTYGTQKEKGIGFGLQLVYGFVNSSNALVDVESTEGEGTIFTLTFPHNN